MSPRLEKWTFRIAVLGLIALVGAFVWQQRNDRPSERPGLTTTTTAPATGEASSTTAAGTTATTGATGATTATTAAPAPSVVTDPGFTVTEPPAGTTVDVAEVEFVGTGPAGEVVHMGTTTATVGEDSVWRMTLALQPGANTFTFTVLNSDGTPLYTTATVTYAAP